MATHSQAHERYLSLVDLARQLASESEALVLSPPLRDHPQVRYRSVNSGSPHTARHSCHDLVQHQCEAPILYRQDWYSTYLDELFLLAQLANWLNAQAEQERTAGDVAAVASIASDILRLAAVIRRSGLFTGLALSIGVELPGLRLLSSVRDALARDSQDTLTALRQHLFARETFCSIVRRDRAWELAVGIERSPEERDTTCCGLHEVCGDIDTTCISNHGVSRNPATAASSPAIHHGLRCAHCTDMILMSLGRLLHTDLGIRTIVHQRGDAPQTLIPAAPLDTEAVNDPFTGRAFRYQRARHGEFLLYGYGPGCYDHGGRGGAMVDILDGKADICLDSVLFAE